MTPPLLKFLAIFLLIPVGVSIAQEGAVHAVFRSTDRGRTWVRADNGIPGDCRINAFGSLDETLFAGTDNGIYISSDQGHNWQPVAGMDSSSSRVIGFATLGNKVFAGTSDKGLLQSTDEGKSWVKSSTFPSTKVRCLISHDGQLFVGTDAEGVFVSDHPEQSWSHLTMDFPPNAQVFALSIIGNKLFAGLYSKGLYAWSHGELRWKKAGRVAPLVLASIDSTLVAGHNPGGLLWSADLGATWSQAVSAPPEESSLNLLINGGELSSDAPVWELAACEDLVIAGASAGIYFSEDRGHTWTQSRTGLPLRSPGVSFLLKKSFILAGTTIGTD